MFLIKSLPHSYSDILTRQSFLNAIVLTNVLGGSTNAVLHLLAMARSANIDLTIDDFGPIADKTPVLANLKPSGDFMMEGTSRFFQCAITTEACD